jgi:exodeoxyribonuclease VII large subunit
MQMILPDENELYQYLDGISNQFTQLISQKLHNKNQELEHLKQVYKQNSIENKLSQKLEEVKGLKERFDQQFSFKTQSYKRDLDQLYSQFPSTIKSVFNSKQNELNNTLKNLESYNPKYKSKKGFAQIAQDKKVIDIDELKKGDEFELMDDKIIISAKVLQRNNIKD